MKDYKQLAAGDDSQGEDNRNQTLIEPGKNLELAGEVLHWIASKTQAGLSKDDAKRWTILLSHQPEWKLMQLANENFTFLNEAWKLLEAMRPEDPTYHAPERPSAVLKQLAGENAPYRSELSKDFWAHVRGLGDFEDFKPKYHHNIFPEKYAKEREEWLAKKHASEKVSLENLHAKHPYVGFDRVIRARGLH